LRIAVELQEVLGCRQVSQLITFALDDAWVNEYAWTPDSRAIYLVANDGTFGRGQHMFEQVLVRLNVTDGRAERVGTGPTVAFASSVSADGRRIAYKSVEARTMGEVAVLDTASGKSTTITDVNPGLRDFATGDLKPISWRSFDGMEIWGLLLTPSGTPAGRRLPTLLYIHGGPGGGVTYGLFPQFMTSVPQVDPYPTAAMAGLGYAVPGTVLALALLSPLVAIDEGLNAVSRAVAGVGVGLVVAGSGAAIVIAYVVRFLAIATGSAQAGMARVSTRMDDAARTLGQKPGSIMRLIHVPLARPALVTATIFAFIAAWNEYVVALTLMSDPDKRPLTVGLTSYVTAYVQHWNHLFAASVIAIVPVAVLFGLIERHLVSGLTAGSVK